jgi:hypothetical protein
MGSGGEKSCLRGGGLESRTIGLGSGLVVSAVMHSVLGSNTDLIVRSLTSCSPHVSGLVSAKIKEKQNIRMN